MLKYKVSARSQNFGPFAQGADTKQINIPEADSADPYERRVNCLAYP